MRGVSPVFEFELIRAGRSRIHWLLRTAYVVVLLFFLHVVFSSDEIQTLLKNGAHLRAMKQTATTYYNWFRICQLVTVLLIAPVLSASSLSEEKSRRTFEFLLSSPLRDAEIVGSKLLLGVLRVWEIVLAGLPLCAICFLLGGLSPGRILADFFLAMTAAWAVGALAMLLAVWTRRLTEALVAVLLLQVAWYAFPIVSLFLAFGGARSPLVPAFLTDWNGFWAMNRTNMNGLWEPTFAVGDALAACTLFGLGCAVASWWTLRSSWAFSQNGGGLLLRALTWKLPGSRQWAPVSVGASPMRWRELQQRRNSSMDRVVLGLVLALGVGVLSLDMTYWQQARDHVAARRNINNPINPTPAVVTMTAMCTSMVYVGWLALPILGILGATAFSEEKNKQLWDVLLTTQLTQKEIIDAKVQRLVRWVGIVLSVHLLSLGLACVSGVHSPITLILLTLHSTASGVFVTILGLYLGLRLRKTSHAIITVLLFAALLGWVYPIVTIGLTRGPDVAVLLLMSGSPCFHPATLLQTEIRDWFIQNGTYAELAFGSVFATMAYGAGVIGVYVMCLGRIGPWKESLEEDWLPHALARELEAELATSPRTAAAP